MPDLTGKNILITGATSGIGRDTVLAAAAAGANVAFTGRREELGRALEAEAAGSFFIRADASREDDCRSMVEATVDRFGALHGAFNNAGVEGMIAPTVDQTVENYRHTLDINVLGVLMSMKYEMPRMIEAGGGSIVNCSSIAGLIGMPGGSVYFASKHAVNGLTKCAALEAAPQGVRVNAVCPAGVETDMMDRFTGGDEEAKAQFAAMHPIGRAGRPREISNLVLWLLSDEATFMTGQCIAADGGYTVQ